MPIIRTLAGMLRYGGFVPTIPGLTPMARRMVIGRILQHTLTAGLTIPSANQALSTFRKYGLGIARSDFLGRYKQLKTLVDKTSQQVGIAPDAQVPNDLIPELRRDWGKKYTYVFRNDYVDAVTGEKKTRFRSFTSSQKMRIDTAQEEMVSAIAASSPYIPLETEHFQFTYMAKRAGS